MVFGTSLDEIVKTETWLFALSLPTITVTVLLTIACTITILASRFGNLNDERSFNSTRAKLWKSRIIFISYR